MQKVIILLLAGAVAGCGATTDATRETTPISAAEDLRRYEAEFHPSEHDPDPAVKGADRTSRPPNARESQAGTPTTAAEQDLIQGFRVQIFATTNIDAAKSKKAEAESFFPSEWFYLQYDPPTYKIRGGNFLQRYEAERFVKQAIEKGYADSWTVPEKVFKNPLPPQR